MTGRYGSQPTHFHFLNPLQLSSELSLSVSHFEADTSFILEGREQLVSTPMVKYPLPTKNNRYVIMSLGSSLSINNNNRYVIRIKPVHKQQHHDMSLGLLCR